MPANHSSILQLRSRIVINDQTVVVFNCFQIENLFRKNL